MWKRIAHFVQYHNFFTIAVMMLFVGASASFAASPALQQSVLNKTQMVRSVDNSFVINTNFDTYDLGLKILSVTEDADMYYVSYSYSNITVQDYAWQPVPMTDSMKVSKKELAGRDLGLYVADQLGQVIDNQVAYLKQVQVKEKTNGLTQKVIATEYTGLIGQYLGTDEKTFDGYTPVKPPPPPEAIAEVPDTSGTAAVALADASNGVSLTSYALPPADPVVPALTRDQLQALIQEAVKQLLAAGTASTTPPVDTPPSPSSSSTPPPPPADTTPPPATITPPADITPPPADATTPPVDTPPTDTVTPPADPVVPPVVDPVVTPEPPVVEVPPVVPAVDTPPAPVVDPVI